MSGRINLQTAPRDELVELIRRQAAKVKELQNASALLQERDDRLAMATQSTSLLKQELAEAKASHAADRAAMQEQLEALSQQVVSGEETIQQLLDAQDAASRGGGPGSGRSASGGGGGPFGTRDDVVSALDAVMVLRAERLEEELILTRANLEQAIADARGGVGAAGTPLDGAAKWARSDEVTSIRAELAAAHHEVAESQAALAQCEAEKAAAEERAHHLAHDLSLLEMRSLCAHVAQPSLGANGNGAGGGYRPGTPPSRSASAAAGATAFSPEGVVPPVLQAPHMGKPSGGRVRAGSSHSLSATMHGRVGGRSAEGGEHSAARVPVSSSTGRFDSSLSSSPASSANTDDDSSSGGGVSWGAAAAVHHHTSAAQEATLVSTSAAGPGGSLFGGGATMSKLRRRIAELEADVARRDKAAASRLREERSLTDDLRSQIATLDAEVTSLRAEVAHVADERASQLRALQQRLDDAEAAADDRELAEEGNVVVAGTVVSPPSPSGVAEQPCAGHITQSMLDRQLRLIAGLVQGAVVGADDGTSRGGDDDGTRQTSAIDEDL